MARRSLLTDDLRERIERELSDGVPVARVAEREGIAKSTIHEWLSTGRLERRPRLRLVDDELPDDDERDTDAKIEAALVGVVLRSAKSGDWRAAQWMLRQRWPERWDRSPS